MAVEHRPAPSTPLDPVAEARRARQRELTEATRADFRHEVDVAYGQHPRQIVDIYYPSTTTTAAPVLVFLHGGGFRNGAAGLHGYNGRPYLERGGLFVSMGYRLAPELRFPDSCEDVESGLQWLVDHVAERGGDPNRIFLSGHSAGAMLAAAVGFRLDLIRGLVLISGQYDVSKHSDEIINRASARYVARTVDAVQRLPARTILVAGDRDLPNVLPDARAVLDAIQSRGGSAELFVEPDADHFAANRGFSSPGSSVARAVGAMLGLPA